MSSSKTFFDKLLTGLQLCGIEWIHFSNVRGECWLEVNGMVIVVMQW